MLATLGILGGKVARQIHPIVQDTQHIKCALDFAYTKHHKMTPLSTFPCDMQGADTNADVITIFHAR